MPYKYTAYNAQGEIVSGILFVESAELAEAVLNKSNLNVIDLRKSIKLPSRSELIAKYLPSLGGAVKHSDVVSFSRDLATLLESGISLHMALDILARQARKQIVRTMIEKVTADLEQGNSLSTALSHHPKVFSNFYIRMIAVGEEVGKLPVVLRELVSHLDKEEAVRRKIKSGMTYPLFVLAIAAVAVVIIMVFVLPSLSGLFEEFGTQMPLMARIVMGVGDFFGAYGKLIMLVLALVVIAAVLYFRTPKGKTRVSALILRVPLVGNISLKNGLGQMSRSLALLIGAGVPLTEALTLTVQTTGNGTLKAALISCQAQVNAGKSFSEAIASDPIFPVLVSQMIAVGENTGRLDTNLEAVADFYEMDSARTTEGVLSWIGPVMIIGVGLVVGVVAVTLFSSIYSASAMLK